jgi:hypothetical protein
MKNWQKWTLGVLALVLVGGTLACNGGKKASAGNPPTSTPAASKSSTQVGPKKFDMGYTATITDNGKTVATVTVGSPTLSKDYDGKAAFYVVVTYVAAADATDTYAYNEYDWAAHTPDGVNLETAILDKDPKGITSLSSGDLAPNKTAKGYLAWKLDGASEHGLELYYSPELWGSAIGYWVNP